MGFKLAELFVSINADSSPLDRALGAIRGKLAKLAATRLTIPGGSFLAALGLGGAGLGLKSIIDDAVTMESKMATLAKATDLEGKALADMKAGLLKLSTTIKGVRINDLLDIATAGAKLGIATKDLAGYTEGIAKVSAALDDIPAGRIAEEIGKLNSVFKLDAVRGTMQLGSAIDKLADSGVSSAKDILDVTQRISGTAVAARITAQESAALAAALLDTGTNAEAGATALQRLIMALNSPEAKDRQNFARVLGVDMATLAETVKNKPMEAIRQFLTAVKGMDALSQQTAIASIGVENIHGLGEIQKLAQQVDVLGKYTGLANHEFRTLDQITKSYDASARTTAAQLAVAANQLQILGDRIGSSLLPSVNAGLSLLGDLATGLGDVWANSAAIVQSWGVDASGAFELVGFGFRNLGDLIELWGTMAGGFLLNTWEVLSYGGEVAGAVAKYLWESMVEAFQITVNAAMNAKDNIVNIFTQIWEHIKSGFKTPIEFKLKGLMDGIDLKGDGKFKMPELGRLSRVDNQLEAIYGRMADREATRDAKAKGKGKVGEGTVLANPAEAGTGTFEAAGKKAGNGGSLVTDIETFARELTDAALKSKGSNTAEQGLAVQKSIDDTLKRMEKQRMDRQTLAGFWG